MNAAQTNPPLTPPRRGTGQLIIAPLLGGAEGGFMIPMHRTKVVGAPHEHRFRPPCSSEPPIARTKFWL